jgi:hypothetical protein
VRVCAKICAGIIRKRTGKSRIRRLINYKIVKLGIVFFRNGGSLNRIEGYLDSVSDSIVTPSSRNGSISHLSSSSSVGVIIQVRVLKCLDIFAASPL